MDIAFNAETGECTVTPTPKLTAEEQSVFEEARERDFEVLSRWNEEMEAEASGELAVLERFDDQLREGCPPWQSASPSFYISAEAFQAPRRRQATAADGSRQCPRCGTDFQPRRKDQAFCGRQCQRNASRCRRSSELGRQADRERDLAAALLVAYIDAPRDQRLGLVKSWLDAARGGDRLLANVLRKPTPRGARSLHSVVWAYRPIKVGASTVGSQFASHVKPEVVIPQLAQWFSLRFLGCRPSEWMNGSAAEPETGEVADTYSDAA